ncbi:Agmatine coumaroyltransferase-2 [Phytophthora cinnamomi]|uniref:Agmatine coumaroyltransferase-2 n=1 Tax=Phytophthora cinnamomi TaxID=4785 RepID=UPI00355AACD5|nr:Agmatine coumaroyltransferase-2 [Phytophthora cinnamomi]
MVNVVTPLDVEGDVFIPMSPMDAVMNTYRVVILYIYPPPSSTAAVYDLDKLRRSFVSVVDEDYSVLVGALDVDEKTGAVSVKQSPEVRRRGGSGIRFETNSTSSQTTDDAIASLSWEFMPRTRTGGEIIAVKGSILADGGMAIGVDCSHVLFDGEATLTFMRAWGQHYSGVGNQDRLVINHERHLLSGNGEASRLPHPEFQIVPAEPLVRREDGSLAPRAAATPPKTSQHVFHLSPVTMAKLKCAAESAARVDQDFHSNDTRGGKLASVFGSNHMNGAQPMYISTLDAITALFTIPITEARGHGKEFRVSTAVNGRKRLEPPLPENYAGNAVFHAISSYSREDLLSDSDDQDVISFSTLSRVARRIRSSILARDSEFMRDTIAFLSNQTGLSSINDNVNFFCGPDVAFTCWAKMGLYDAEFGGMRPWYASIPRVQCMDGFVLITEAARGAEGLDVLVCLESASMKKFMSLCAKVEYLQDQV